MAVNYYLKNCKKSIYKLLRILFISIFYNAKFIRVHVFDKMCSNKRN